MRRILIGTVAASLTVLIGVALATLGPASPLMPSEHASPSPAAGPARPNFGEVFRDFDFVGSSPIAESVGGECACPHGSKEALPKPEVFEAGQVYAFHYRGVADSDLLFEAFHTRLNSFGLETSVLPGPFLGMRLHPHGLRFQGSGYAGSVRHSLHCMSSKGGQQSQPCDVIDYVLILEKRPE